MSMYIEPPLKWSPAPEVCAEPPLCLSDATPPCAHSAAPSADLSSWKPPWLKWSYVAFCFESLETPRCFISEMMPEVLNKPSPPAFAFNSPEEEKWVSCAVVPSPSTCLTPPPPSKNVSPLPSIVIMSPCEDGGEVRVSLVGRVAKVGAFWDCAAVGCALECMLVVMDGGWGGWRGRHRNKMICLHGLDVLASVGAKLCFLRGTITHKHPRKVILCRDANMLAAMYDAVEVLCILV